MMLRHFHNFVPPHDINIPSQADPSTKSAEYIRELEDTLAELERKLKLAKAEAKVLNNNNLSLRRPF
jgi:hypothetical protein